MPNGNDVSRRQSELNLDSEDCTIIVVLHEHSPTIAAQAFFPFIEFSNKLSVNVSARKERA